MKNSKSSSLQKVRNFQVRAICLGVMMLVCSHSHNDVHPKPQLYVSMALIRGALHPFILVS